jgi:simple sugar transport system ATP-binding protein
LLAARGITVRYPAVLALRDLDFTVAPGEVHALMGENGAGKSTLTRVLAGLVHPQQGTLTLGGQTVQLTGAREAESRGISTVHQELDLIPTMSVADNICLGRYTRRFGLVDLRATRARAEKALARLDVHLDVSARLDSVPIAVQQLVAISRALDVDARVLILDEATSSLDQQETARLFAVVRRLRDAGMGIVFISHFLDQVYALADRITILRNGERVGEWATGALPRHALIEAMTGTVPASVESAPSHAAHGVHGTHAMMWSALGRARSIAASSGSVQAGEALGLAGLRGSGRTELARLLFGADTADSGSAVVAGTRLARGALRQAIALGVALAPEDRQAQGLVLDLSVVENIVLALQARRGALRVVGGAERRRLAQHYITALGIRTPSPDVPVRQLSGGNQQKVLLARWLAIDPTVLIVDQPTRGMDVGARAEIEALLLRLVRGGVALIVASDELDELVRLADRVLVLRDRHVVGELTGAAVTARAILARIAAPHAGAAEALSPAATDAGLPPRTPA